MNRAKSIFTMIAIAALSGFGCSSDQYEGQFIYEPAGASREDVREEPYYTPEDERNRASDTRYDRRHQWDNPHFEGYERRHQWDNPHFENP